MTPYWSDDHLTLHGGDCRAVLAELPAESVHCVVTSPPYWGLRDYGTATWDGGDPACDHRQDEATLERGYARASTLVGTTTSQKEAARARHACRCGARRIDSQLGLEPTPEEYVANMVAVFREVRRVLRKDGTLWLNLGDSYATSPAGNAADKPSGFSQKANRWEGGAVRVPKLDHGLKPKDLVGIPWRVAFALQADGWVLRSDVVWSKPNPMPESVTDRPTKAHEMLFLFSKARWIGPQRGQFADISDEDARWLALFLDTEGNIVIKRAQREDGRTQYGAQMVFANTSRALLERVVAIVGKGTIHERAGTNAPMHYWQVSGREARDLLYRIAPYLIVKQRQARVAIHMQDVVAEPGRPRPGRRRTEDHEEFLEKCWQTVKALNRFGDPDLSWVPELRYGKWDPERYYYDAEAVREDATGTGGPTFGVGRQDGPSFSGSPRVRETGVGGRNLRSVWTIATEPYPGAHFATFPRKLVEPCVKAGTSERGVCPECGAPWVRVVERQGAVKNSDYADEPRSAMQQGGKASTTLNGTPPSIYTTGWRPACRIETRCHDAEPVPAVVLDPFAGSGTTLLVAQSLGRRAIGIDLNPDYLKQALARNAQTPLGLVG